MGTFGATLSENGELLNGLILITCTSRLHL